MLILYVALFAFVIGAGMVFVVDHASQKISKR